MKPWTIVVGVDGTAEARAAAELGRRLAEGSGGSLHLITATEDPLGYSVTAPGGMDVTALDEAIRDEAWRAAAAGLEGLFTEDELGTLLRVGLGRPEAVVAERGWEVDADLFILGGHRRGPVQNWVHRSTTRHLARISSRPIVITGPAGPVIQRILVAVDFAPVAVDALRLGSELATLLQAPMEAVHVVHQRDFPDSREVMLALKSLMDAEEREARKRLAPLVPEEATWNLVRGRPVPVLEEMAAAVPSTLLVLGAQGRGWVDRLLIGSTTGHMLSSLPCSLAVVPAPVEAEPGRSSEEWEVERSTGGLAAV